MASSTELTVVPIRTELAPGDVNRARLDFIKSLYPV